jgi:16S rRNA (uracil1498-N3)-methyltransferase
LASDDVHHLMRVLRLAPGTEITVGDGAGRWRPARLVAGAGGAEPGLKVTGDVVVDPRPEPAVIIAFALVKGERPELTVQKVTEVGADRIMPFVAERSVVRWDAAKAARQVVRLRAIARGASMQSRRTWLPEVTELATFAEVAALPGAALADRDGEAPSLTHPVVLVGPEGGWASAERSAALPRVRLGGQILRTETAAITSCVILCALRDGTVASS